MSDAASANAPAPTGRRQQGVEETRQRIVDAARQLFGAEGFHGVGLEEVAERAGVGRKTIYYQFGSKLGLLEALVANVSERGGVSEFVGEALADDDVARAVRRFVAGSCSVWERDAPVCRALLTLAASDTDARTVIDRVNDERLQDLHRLAGRARRAGRLREGWTAVRAADALWLLTSFESYDLLRRAGKSPGEATNLLCDLALGLVHP